MFFFEKCKKHVPSSNPVAGKNFSKKRLSGVIGIAGTSTKKTREGAKKTLVFLF
jgi:hypothetical protein